MWKKHPMKWDSSKVNKSINFEEASFFYFKKSGHMGEF